MLSFSEEVTITVMHKETSEHSHDLDVLSLVSELGILTEEGVRERQKA